MMSCSRFWQKWVAGTLVLAGLGTGQGMVWAQAWTRLGETDQVALFVNRNSIEKEGNLRRVWEMQDLKQPDQDGVQSRRYMNEYDCQHKMYRISQMTSFEGPQLSGRKLFEVKEAGYWRKIPPNGLFTLGYIAHCIP
ncbi:MAG: hypothetical protein RL657_1001 [Pseudomonadota bacterium]|jgi:hypothetical protein